MVGLLEEPLLGPRILVVEVDCGHRGEPLELPAREREVLPQHQRAVGDEQALALADPLEQGILELLDEHEPAPADADGGERREGQRGLARDAHRTGEGIACGDARGAGSRKRGILGPRCRSTPTKRP